MLGKKIINTGGVACTTDTTQILDGGTTQSTALYRFEDNANDTASGTGKFNKGGVFNGSSSKIVLPAILPTSSTADSSVSFWFKYSGGQSGTGTLFSSYGGNSAQPGYHLGLEAAYTWNGVNYPDGSLFLTGYSMGTGSGVNGTTSYADGEWHHVVVTYDFSTGVLSCFVDNASSATLSISFTSRPSTIGPFSQSGDIGYQLHGGPHRYAKCSIDQFRIFNKDLSTSERTTLYNETTTTANTLQVLGDTSCVAAYTFEGNANDLDTSTPKNGTATNVIYDYSGTASNVTYAAGKFDKAAVFNGSSSYIELPSALSDGATTVANCISFWFNVGAEVTSSTSNNEIMQFAGTSSVTGKIALGSTSGYMSNETFSVTHNVAGFYTYSKTNIPAGWNHAIVQWNSSDGKWDIYINSVKHTTYTYGTQAQGYWKLKFGNRSSIYYTGSLDQIRIFDKALSLGEINSLYNETTTTAALGTITNPSTIAYYKMQGPADETGFYNGTATNMDFNSEGKYGFAGKFNGGTSWLSTGLLLPAPQLTWSAWIKTSNTKFTYVVGDFNAAGANATHRFSIRLDSSSLKASINDSAGGLGSVVTFGTYTQYGSWAHIVITVDGASVKGYVNGSQLGSTQTASLSITAGVQPLILGAYGPNTSTHSASFDGLMDQVRIFNKAISASEVTKLYNEVQCANTITTPESYFNSVLYTGNATSRSITTTFQPDFVWLKNRGPSARNHRLFDSVRGATKGLYSDLSNAEYTENSLTAFNTNGFTLGTAGNQNVSSENYVAWAWKSSGILNQSASFNGSSSRITLPKLSTITADVTVSGWLNLGNTTTSNRIRFLEINTNANGYAGTLSVLYKPSNGQWVARAGNGTSSNSDVLTHTYTLTQSTWYHVCFTRNDSTNETKFYINGSLQDTETVSVSSSYPSNATGVIGDLNYSAGSNYNWLGTIDQVRIFNKSLSSSEVTQLYNETASTINTLQVLGDTSCMATYPLGTNANDLSTNYNGTASNITFNQPGHLNRNTNGTIQSTVSASPESGFSIVKYIGNATSGATFGHGLNKKPDLILIKNLAHGGNYHWTVYSGPNGATGLLYLNLNDAFTSTSSRFNNTEPTSSVVTLGNDGTVNDSGDDHIAYCFANVEGYQHIGSYVGNGSANGPYIYTGFEPAWIMIKRTDATGSWNIFDNKRNSTNPRNSILQADKSDQEYTNTNYNINFYTNGFQFLNSNADWNASGGNYIFLAIAANPDTTAPTKANSFKTKIYTGNGGTQSITGLGFKPDLVWIKNRDTTGKWHSLADSVRGGGKRIFSNEDDAELTDTYDTQSFDTDGFSIGNGDFVSRNNESHVSWNWKGLDHDRNLAAINTDGSITSIVSANPAAGFSIVQYTSTGTSGSTVGHGLSSAPQIAIIKCTSTTGNWITSITNVVSNKYLYLNNDGTGGTGGFSIDGTNITLDNTYGDANTSGRTYVAYCWHSVAGYSKISTYSGTGSDGNAITNVGFQPSFILIKRTDSTDNWNIVDDQRGNNALFPDLTSQELSNSGAVVFNTNGFTINGSAGGYNNSSGTYLYMAFK